MSSATDKINARLDELAALEDGWLDGEGKAMEPAGLALIRAFILDAVENRGLPEPYLYPSEDGGVHGEWDFPAARHTVRIDFGPDGRRVECLAVPIGGPLRSYSFYAMSAAENAEEIVAFVKRHEREGA